MSGNICIQILASEVDRVYNSYSCFFPIKFTENPESIKDVIMNDVLTKGFVITNTVEENTVSILHTRFKSKQNDYISEVKIELTDISKHKAETLTMLIIGNLLFIQKSVAEGSLEAALNACDFLIPFTLDCNQNS